MAWLPNCGGVGVPTKTWPTTVGAMMVKAAASMPSTGTERNNFRVMKSLPGMHQFFGTLKRLLHYSRKAPLVIVCFPALEATAKAKLKAPPSPFCDSNQEAADI